MSVEKPNPSKNFDEAVWQVVADIPAGQVLSYGNVARMAGFPKRARMVAKAMSRSPEPLPWHRVVKSDLSIAFQVGSEPYQQQKKRLLSEGVTMSNGKLKPRTSDKNRALDEILWGPDSH